MMSRVCAALSDLDFSSDDSSSSEEDERPKRKIGNFTGLCLMGKASQHISDSDSDVSNDSSLESLSLRVIKLENALCNQDKLLCKVFRENKKLNLELESASSKIASLRSAHDDMSAKPCDKCNMIMVNYGICGLCIPVLLACLIVSDWNSGSSKLVPHFWVPALVVRCLDLIWRLLPLRLRILSTNLIILLATLFYPLHVKHMFLSRVSFSMLPKRTPSYSRRSLI
jgi:hypothetical protein